MEIEYTHKRWFKHHNIQIGAHLFYWWNSSLVGQLSTPAKHYNTPLHFVSSYTLALQSKACYTRGDSYSGSPTERKTRILPIITFDLEGQGFISLLQSYTQSHKSSLVNHMFFHRCQLWYLNAKKCKGFDTTKHTNTVTTSELDIQN